MTWSLVFALPVLACALAVAGFVSWRARVVARAAAGESSVAGSPASSEVFGLQVIGYPTERVDLVLDRLDAQIAANDVLLSRAEDQPTDRVPNVLDPDGTPE